MGQFSWIASDDRKSVLDNVSADVYLLIPAEFGGGYHHTNYYDGYGNFGTADAYEEVARWNKKYLNKIDAEFVDVDNPSPWEVSKAMVNDFISLNESDFKEKYGNNAIRLIGTTIACYDNDNGSLPYPIKITHAPMKYEDVTPSIGDLNQGWGCDQAECEEAYQEFLEEYYSTYKAIGDTLKEEAKQE